MEMISAKDASLELGVSLRRVQQLISTGRLPATQIGGSWIINKPDLALVAERKAGRPKKEGAAEVAPAPTPEPTKPRSAKSLTEAEKKRIRDAQQRRWAGAKPAQKNSKK